MTRCPQKDLLHLSSDLNVPCALFSTDLNFTDWWINLHCAAHHSYDCPFAAFSLLHPVHIFQACVSESAKKENSSMSRSHFNHTPCNFKRRDCTGCHVCIVDKVGCYGRETRRSVNHFKIFHARRGLPNLEESQSGKEIRTLWQGLAQFALSLCHLALLAY